jgi:hypothetical protein
MSDPSGTDGARTLMWEARAADGRADELLAWVLDAAPLGEVFRAADRVVLVVDVAASDAVPEPPPDLLARPAHAWRFSRVR